MSLLYDSALATGQQFGRWTLVQPAGRKHGHLAWLCRCICGTERVVEARKVQTGRSRSCGCYSAELVALRFALPSGEGGFRRRLRLYRKQAAWRGHTWELSEAQVRGLFNGDCAYCGSAPASVCANYNPGRGPAVKCGPTLTYNGIDRIDNSNGYTPDNCVSCCEACNRAKATMSVEEFLGWVRRVYAHSIWSDRLVAL